MKRNELINKQNYIYWIIAIVAILIFVMIVVFFNHSSPSNVLDSIATTTKATSTPVSDNKMFKYIEIVSGCDPYFKGKCVNVRSGPGIEYSVINRLRTGIILKVDDIVIKDGQTWYKINIDKTLYYPERVKGDWYVSTDGVSLFEDDGTLNYKAGDTSTSSKKIVVDVSKQTLTAYEGNELFMEVVVSTGLELTPTTIGTFSIFKKTPSRYMQGPIPGSLNKEGFDLPGVPWDLYFTKGGEVIHGAYWYVGFGHRWSHGCVNLPPLEAKKLYEWAEVGTTVVVQR